MVIGMSLTFIGWNVIALFICSKYFMLFHYYVLYGSEYGKQRKNGCYYEKYDKYNRVFVLKHGIYIIIYSLVCALLLEIISYFSFIYKSNVNFNWQFYLNNWNMNIAFLSNPILIKYTVLVFFTLNGLILPFYSGI